MNQSEPEPKKGGFLSRFFNKGSNAVAEAPEPTGNAGVVSKPTEIAMTQSSEPAGRRLAKSKSVLIIAADDAGSRRWKRELQEWGYGVESTDDGQKGLDTIYEVAFDALLLDLRAPKIDGLEILRNIRAQDELKSVFIGAFSQERDGAEQEVIATDAGANRVFQRGKVGVDEILTSLKTALFPRILQAQPRSKQQVAAAAAAPAGKPSGTPTVPAPAIPRPAISLNSDAEPSQVPASASLNKKLLIIDADESVAGLYRSQIEAAGYEVEVALDGETGFHDLYKTSPDVLLLDLLLPGDLSGSEILKKTRAQKKFEKIPILVFSSLYTRDVEEEARNAGVLRLFNKAAATPRDVIDALNEIFLPSKSMHNPMANRPSIRFDEAKPGDAPRNPASATISMSGETPAAPAAESANDNAFQSEIRESLLQNAPEFVKSLRGLLQVLLRSQGDPTVQGAQLLELYTRVHSLTANAAIAGFAKVARLAGALEAMLREFHVKPEGLNASTRRTLTQAMDFLALLFTNAALHEDGTPIEEQILVCDDEIISRRVIGHSLEKAGLKSTAVSHPDEALRLLQDKPFDLIFLDVEMPGMNGFELCKKLRALPLHAKTPVIFVTALNGFESRAKSSLSGGDDFIGKPFSYIELAVKALIYVLRESLGDKVTQAPTVPLTISTTARAPIQMPKP